VRHTLADAALLLFLLAAAGRFLASGLVPAATALRGDFGIVFPSESFARLRPDWPPPTVWGARGPGDPEYAGLWFYGPMLHFLTLPLFTVPTRDLVAPAWALINTAALAASFVLAARLAQIRASTRAMMLLAALWMGFQPLVNCLAQGNVEIVELALVLAGLSSLHAARAARAGAWLGAATMVKYLPIGFLAWLALRGRSRAVAGGVLAIAAVAIVTALTLGWENSTTVNRVPGRLFNPPGGLHDLSITSIYLHRTAVRDPLAFGGVAWRSPERMKLAQRAGLLTSGLVGITYAVLIWRRRRQPIAAPEVGVLFLLMLLLPPWNHDYYYIFALVPLSMVVLTALQEGSSQTRQRPVMIAALVAYVLMSPPVPYGVIDRLGWFDARFAHLWNFADLPTYGALLLLAAITCQWLTCGAFTSRFVTPAAWSVPRPRPPGHAGISASVSRRVNGRRSNARGTGSTRMSGAPFGIRMWPGRYTR
jgi:hypothetical protein